MVVLFYTLVFMAIWHFFYESVIATSLRHGLRYQFFKLRDELRMVKIENDLSDKDEEVYSVLDNSICSMINSMSYISMANYFRLKHDIGKDREIKKELEKTSEFIKSADNERLRSIDGDMARLGSRALIINNGAWGVYLILPLLAIIIGVYFSFHFDKLRRQINKVSTRLIYSAKDFTDSSNYSIG